MNAFPSHGDQKTLSLFHPGTVPCYHCEHLALNLVHRCTGDGTLEVTALLLHCQYCHNPSEIIYGEEEEGKGFGMLYRDAEHFKECHPDFFDNVDSVTH